MIQFKLYLFGPPRLERDGQPIVINQRKVLALLMYLAVTRQTHSRDMLATLLWPEKNQQAARANLRRTLYDLSQLLGEPLLDVAAETVSLAAGAPIWLDTEQFQSYLTHCPLPDRWVQALDAVPLMSLSAAVELYTADFLAGFRLPDCRDFDDWQFFQREELRRTLARLLQQVVVAYQAAGKVEEAVRYARRWLHLDPLEQSVQRQLMQLYAQAGQSAAALRQYEECVHILETELGVPPEAETTALYEALRTRRFLVPGNQHAPSAADPAGQMHQVIPLPNTEPSDRRSVAHFPSHHLPAPPTRFVGRQQELAELLCRLADPACRLLTLVGPGGIGKTRLVIEAAQVLVEFGVQGTEGGALGIDVADSERQTQPFSDGVFFVPLQPVTAPSGVVPAIANALRLQFYGEMPAQEQLLNFLHEKEILLVLDNFEHLLGSVALVGEILARASGVKLLVTSREALNLHEEWFHPLAGMRLPPQVQMQPHSKADSPTQIDETIATYDAVQLFVQAARRALVTFDPEAQLMHIVRICQLLDGMPLGIELAAAWLKVLSAAQIVQEIERGIDILVTRHQNVPARHRNMRVVMAQSWQLLDEKTQRVLKRLSIFQGGFLQEAAAAVTGAGLLPLAELIDKAWVYKLPGKRYQMHELLRQFAAEKLAEVTTDQTETQDRHAAFYLQQVAQWEQALIGPEQRAALDEIGTESDNIQAAWTRAAERLTFNLIHEALQALYLFFLTRSRYMDGEALFIHALRQLDQTGAGDSGIDCALLRCRLLARIGSFRHYQGDLVAADAYCETALSANPDHREQAFLYELLGRTARLRGDRPAAEAALHKSHTLGRDLDDQNQMACALHALAETVASFGDFVESEQFAREALGLCQQFQRPDLTTHVLATLAWATSCRGRYREAEQYYRESLLMAEKIGNPYGIALATNFLGWMAFCEAGTRLLEALTLYDRAMAIWRQIGQQSNLAMCLGDYALAACELGEYVTAFGYAQEGLAITEKLNHFDLTAYNLNGLGAAACGLDDLAASRRYLLRALQMTTAAKIPDSAALTLYFLARLLIKESKLVPLLTAERLQKQLQALELLTLVMHHPVAWQLFRDRAQRAQTELAGTLPADVAEAAIERGQRRTLAAVTAEILPRT